MIDKEDITIGDRFKHPKGICTFTEVAFALEAMNPDSTSLFVLFDGTNEEIEISLSLLEPYDDIPRLCNICFKPIETDDNICKICAGKLLRTFGDSNEKQ